MINVYIQHTVADFDIWKAGYDEHEAQRRAAGCTSATISRPTDDGNGTVDVSALLTFRDLAGAQGFLDNPELPKVMEAAGVVGAPDIRIAEQVESLSY